MAGRQFNRLRKQLGDDLQLLPEPDGSSSEEETSAEQHKPFNPFELLTDDDEGSRLEEDGEDDHIVEEVSTDVSPQKISNQLSSRKNKQKQRKKKKSKPEAAEAEATPQQQEDKAEEDIDKILQELNIKAAPSATAGNDAEQPSSTSCAAAPPGHSGGKGALHAQGRPLLGVDVRRLKADDELRRLFGGGVLDEEGEERGAAFAGASRRVRRLAARGLIQKAQLKKGAIINPRDTWPRFDGGFSMEYVGATEEGRHEFTYAYSQGYQAVQELYEQCQASFDPNNVAALLHSHPYHLDALLTMHDLYRSMAENSYADEMLERCVYALEMAWHPSFNLSAASMFVRYNDANKPLFLALFKYQQALSRRGLHRTALELCKLLLALNPQDPQGALFTIDYLAVRAGQYDFLRRFVQQYAGGDGSLHLLPNLAFSQALAAWYQEQDRREGGKRGGADAAAAETGGSGEGGSRGLPPSNVPSSDLLTKAVLLHPLVVLRLLRKLQEKGAGQDSDWSYLLSQPLLRDADDGGSPSLSHLVDLFVERQHLMWKAQPILEWLKAACRRALEGGDLLDGISAADWACVREQAFPPSDENQYRHLRQYDFSDVVQRLPPEDMHGMQLGGGGGGGAAGVRPEELVALEAELQQLDARVRQEGRVPEEYLREGNPLMMLVRSLMPWFNPGQQPDYELDGDDAGAEHD